MVVVDAYACVLRPAWVIVSGTMQKLAVRPRFVKRLAALLILFVLLTSIAGQALGVTAGSASQPTEPNWAMPGAMALRRIGPLGTSQNQPNFLSNLDCTPLTYRLVGQSAQQDGCLTSTAYGMLDSSTATVIFNGTDEGLRLLSYSPHQVLAPWPQALNLLTLDASSTGGSYIGMYTNPIALTQDQRDFAGRLTGKQLTQPPNILFRDHNGQRLVVNAQTIAFSQGGGWMVAEALGGSFVRINLATLDMTAFAPHFGTQSNGGLLNSQIAISDDGRFVAIQNAVTGTFKVYDLTTCDGLVANLRPENCRAYDYQAFISQQVSGLHWIRHVRFINNGLVSFEASSVNGTTSGVYILAPTSAITSMADYIALGDSYTSGEGTFNYLAGTDSETNNCHLSSHSYPLLLTRDLFGAAGGHSVACSGAVINDIGSDAGSYRGQVKQGRSFDELFDDQARLEGIKADFKPGYIAQQHFVRHYQPRVVTVSIGGNDIGFGDLLQRCVMPHISRHLSDSTCYNTYESRQEVVRLVDRTVPRWTALYRQLRAASPSAQIYALGYPSVSSGQGKCGTNVRLGKSELEFAEELIAYLNGAISQAATAAGVPYIDIRQALVGHRLCEAVGNTVAVNGLTAGKDSGPFGIGVLGRESYHPNALGHQLIAQAITQNTANLTSSNLTASPGSSPENLLDAPKSGRTLNRLAPDNGIAPSILQNGDRFTVNVNGLRNGLRPNTYYVIRIDGGSGPILASVLSGADGSLSTETNVPLATVPGGHSIDIFGNGQDGAPVNVTQPVYIIASADDPDEDGFSGAADSCPYAVNSNEDIDGDSVDDVCDPSLTAASSTSLPPAPENTAAPVTGNPQNSSILTPQLHPSDSLLDPVTHQIIESPQPPALSSNSRTPLAHSASVKIKPRQPHITIGNTSVRPAVLSAQSAAPQSLPQTVPYQSKYYQPTAYPKLRLQGLPIYLAALPLSMIFGMGVLILRRRQRAHI